MCNVVPAMTLGSICLSWRGSDRRGEFTLDYNDCTRRGLDGGADHEGANLIVVGLDLEGS